MNKSELDRLIIKFKGQPVGNGYIDIIVKRENYQSFVSEVLALGFKITAISWWEHINSLDKKSKYGLGGPESKYYSGWFPEICGHFDELDNSKNNEQAINDVINLIENKVIDISESVTFQNYTPLTPGFWIDVPDDWKNEFS